MQGTHPHPDTSTPAAASVYVVHDVMADSEMMLQLTSSAQTPFPADTRPSELMFAAAGFCSCGPTCDNSMPCRGPVC